MSCQEKQQEDKKKMVLNVSIKRKNNLFQEFFAEITQVQDYIEKKKDSNNENKFDDFTDQLKTKVSEALLAKLRILPNGDIIFSGKITGILRSAVLLNIFKDLDGVISYRELDWDAEKVKNRISFFEKNPQEVVQAKLLEINKEAEKVSLSIKQMEPDPLSQILEKHPVGSVLKGTISSIIREGLILDTENYKSVALVRLSGLPVDKKIKSYSIHDSVKAKVIGVEWRNRMLVVSIKAAQVDSDKKAAEAYAAPSSFSLNEVIQDEFFNKK